MLCILCNRRFNSEDCRSCRRKNKYCESCTLHEVKKYRDVLLEILASYPKGEIPTDKVNILKNVEDSIKNFKKELCWNCHIF